MRPIDYFDTAAEANLGRVALLDGDRKLTFSELSDATHEIARAIHTRYGSSSTIGIYSPNDYRLVCCTLGVMRAGCAVAPIHVRNSVEDGAAFVNRVAPRCVLFHEKLSSQVERLKRLLDVPAEWLCMNAEPFVSNTPTNAGASYEDSKCGDDDVRCDNGSAVYVRQTSGTAGPPKLVIDDVLSFNASQRVLRQVLAREVPAPVCLVVAPLSHAAGVHAFSMLTLGATLVIIDGFDSLNILRCIERHHVTHIWLPPTALYLLLDCPEIDRVDLSSLRSLVLGAAAVSPDKLSEAVRKFGPCVSLNYSQIESGFLTWLDETTIASAVAGQHAERLSSSGTSLFISRFRIMDESGRWLRQGEIGEIVVRGHSVKDYVDPVDMVAARRNGWHHTEDLGYVDDAGFLYVVGRTKDMIVSGGFKIAAADVERAIMQLPAIKECAVVGVPDTIRGESLMAVVTFMNSKAIDIQAIISHCRAVLGQNRTPRRIEQWDEIPKTSVGKIDKKAIRARLTKSVESRQNAS